MRILLDTNILLRISEPSHPHHANARSALQALGKGGHSFCISSQTVSEFLAVATRSVADRGLGMEVAMADAELSKLIAALEMLFESKAVVDALRRLALRHGVSGKSIHDAKIVAAMLGHGVAHLLTFNLRDFTRFKEVSVLDPQNLVVPP